MTMIKMGYARVSTAENRQELGLDLQLRALEKAGCQYVYSEQLSGTDDSRPEFKRALRFAKRHARQGNQVEFDVYKLDRLSRSMLKSVGTIKELTEAGVQVVSLREHLDTSTPTGILQYQMLASFSEYEVNTIRQRTSDALRELKRQGVQLGRPRIEEAVVNKICDLYRDSNTLVREIAVTCGVSEATVYNIAKRHQLSRRKNRS